MLQLGFQLATLSKLFGGQLTAPCQEQLAQPKATDGAATSEGLRRGSEPVNGATDATGPLKAFRDL